MVQLTAGAGGQGHVRHQPAPCGRRFLSWAPAPDANGMRFGDTGGLIPRALPNRSTGVTLRASRAGAFVQKRSSCRSACVVLRQPFARMEHAPTLSSQGSAGRDVRRVFFGLSIRVGRRRWRCAAFPLHHSLREQSAAGGGGGGGTVSITTVANPAPPAPPDTAHKADARQSARVPPNSQPYPPA